MHHRLRPKGRPADAALRDQVLNKMRPRCCCCCWWSGRTPLTNLLGDELNDIRFLMSSLLLGALVARSL